MANTQSRETGGRPLFYNMQSFDEVTVRTGISIPMLLSLLLLAGVGGLLYDRLQRDDAALEQGGARARAVPVEVAPVERRVVTQRRSFTGTLEPRAEFMVSPKIDGRIVELAVDLGDSVSRDQVVARLDDAEHRQEVARAKADLAVARANLAEARSLLVIAERELQRIEELQKRGVSSVSQQDVAKADQLAKQAHVEVTRAQLARAEADLEAARIRLGYTRVRAAWQGADETRVVAERFVDEGETISVNTPLLRIVELDPVIAVFFVTERDYARLQMGQTVELNTDAYPGTRFIGQIARIAPVFREQTRQARVEVRIDNPALQLKPGMYARLRVELASVAGATVVPEQAVTTRDGEQGVFVVAPGNRVVWRPLQLGIREAGVVQVLTPDLTGRVVTLGQQQLDDGSSVTVTDAGQGE